MAINDKLIVQEAAAAGGDSNPNILLDLNASDVDSYDGDGDIWYDIHDFEYKPTTNVAQHFNTVLYDGDDNTVAQPITGAGFTPDLVWIKTRNQATRHILTDSIRGVSSQLFSSESSAPIDYAEFTSFDLDGFTVKRNTGTDYLNQSGIEYVAWCFKAGGASVTNTNGDLQSQVSANNDLGFSIVTYTGNNSFGQTVGHGLDVQPQMVIYKNLSNARNWRTYVEAIGATKYLNLDDNSAGGTYGSFNNTSPTSTVFSTTNSVADRATNFNGDNFIAYCFTSKRGVSKVGSYAGGAAGNRIYTGFEPAFVIAKHIGTGSWEMYDNARGKTKKLWANESSQEATNTNPSYIEFNRDGFTFPITSGGSNATGNSYIYYAVAKNTNETSLIADTNLELHLDAASFPEKGETGYNPTPTTWNDLTSNGYVATITGGEFDSELGNSIKLTHDSSRIQVKQSGGGASSALTNVANFTVEMWVNMTDLSDYQMIWSNMLNSENKRQCYGFITDTDLLEFTIYSSNTSTTYRQLRTGNVGGKIYGKWTHICFQLIGSAPSKIWIDGEEQAVTTISGSGRSMHTNALSDFQIASSNNSVSGGLDGGVGQVRMYHSVLTQDEIRQNFNFTKPRYPNYFHGTLGAGTAKPAWNAGGYFEFDGSNDKVDISSVTIPVNDFSYSLWFKTDSTTKKQILLSHYNGGFSYGIQLNQSTNSVIGSYALQEGGSTNYLATNSITLDTTDWHNVVLTKSSSTGHILYYDGNQIAINSSFTGPLQRGTTTNQIGASTSANFFDGQISKFRVYDNVLTTTEITALYNEGE